MKKVINICMLLMCLAFVPKASASKTFLVNVDSSSKVKLVHAALSSSLAGFGNEIGLSNGFQQVTASDDNVAVRGTSYNNSPTSVYVNGSPVSRSGSGKAYSPYYYDISSLSDGDLVEIYYSSSTSKYEYDLTLSFNDKSSHITSVKVGSYTYPNIPSSVKFKYGDVVTVYTTKQASEYSLTGRNTTVNVSGGGDDYSYSFTPFPNPSAPVFSLTIPGDNVYLNASADDSSMLLGYEINGKSVSLPAEFHAGDEITVYTKYEPVSYTGVSGISFEQSANSRYKGTFTAPITDVSLGFTFKSTFTTSIDASNLILAYVATDTFGTTRELEKTGAATFYKGDTFTMYSMFEPTGCVPERSWSSTKYNGTDCYVTSFLPTADGTLKLTFNDGEFYAQIQDDEDKIADLLDEYFAGYQCIHFDGSRDDIHHIYNADQTKTFSNYGSCTSTFGAGDSYVMYFKAKPELMILDGAELEPKEENIGGVDYVAYYFTPTDKGHLNIKFGSPTVVGPSTEATFTVKIKADRAGVVNAQVRTNSGNTDYVIGEGYMEIECPESGYIYCTIIDESMYSYQAFLNEDENVDFLDYNPPTTYPVTIRKTRAISDTDMIDNSGDKFSITTNSKANLQWYELTLNIVDDASNVRVEVGPSYQAKSQSNRTIADLQVGANTIRYNETETYLVVSSKNFRSLYNVFSNNASYPVTRTESSPAEFYMSINGQENLVVKVEPNEPIEEGDKTFTFNVDHPELVTSMRRFVGGNMQSYADITDFATTNTIDFCLGDEFRIFLSADYEPEYVTKNGTPIEPWNGLYDFTPAEDDVVVVHYGELPALPTFTVVTDRPDQVSQLYNYTRGRENPITQEFTTLEFFAGDVFQIRFNNQDPRYITFNGNDVTSNGTFYTFCPEGGGTLKIIFSKEPTPPTPQEPMFTLIVDDASQLIEIYDNEADASLCKKFVDGENTIPVGTGTLLIYVEDKAVLVTVDGKPVDVETGRKDVWYEVTVHDGSVVNMKFTHDPRVTFITDDKTKMIGFEESDLIVGRATLTFEVGDKISFGTPEGVKPLCVKRNGDDVPLTDGLYTFSAVDGDVVKVFFNHIPTCEGELYQVQAAFVNPGTEDFINYFTVDDETYSDYSCLLTGNLLVDAYSSVGINYKNHDYIINSISVNGTERPAPYTGAFSVTATKNIEMVFDVEKPQVINYSVVTECPNDVELYYPDSAQQSGKIEIYLEAPEEEDVTSYPFVTNALHPTLVIEKKNGVEALIDVNVNGVAAEADEYDRYVINLHDGDEIEVIRTEVVFDKAFLMFVDMDTTESDDFSDIEHTGVLTAVKSGREIKLNDGRNIVAFNSRYDGAFLLGFDKMPYTLHTYVDDKLIELDHSRLDMVYYLEVSDNTIVRSFYRSTTDKSTETVSSWREVVDEETGDVTYVEEIIEVSADVDITPDNYEVAFDFDNEMETEIIIVRDNFIRTDGADVNHNDPTKYMEGTLFSIFVTAGQGMNLYIDKYVEEAVYRAPGYRGAPAKASEEDADRLFFYVDPEEYGIVPPEGKEHVISFITNGPLKVVTEKTNDGIVTGIEDVDDDAVAIGDVYTVQGVLIKANASVDDLINLPAGVYIFGGHKLYIK